MEHKTIKNVVEFTAEELGVYPLVFDKPFLNIDYVDSNDILINISVKLSNNYIDNLVKKAENSLSEDVYERLLFPVLLVEANLAGEINGKLNGIIRPKLTSTEYIKPIKESMPEFFFRITNTTNTTNTEKRSFEGKAMHSYSNSNNEGIICGIRPISEKEITEMGNLFEIKMKNSAFCNIYYRK